MSISVGLVVVVVYPLFIVVLVVNVRVINIAVGWVLNNVHNSCWAYCTKWRKLSAVSLTQSFLHITHSFVFLRECWCGCELFGAACGSECPINLYNCKKNFKVSFSV